MVREGSLWHCLRGFDVHLSGLRHVVVPYRHPAAIYIRMEPSQRWRIFNSNDFGRYFSLQSNVH